MAINEADFDREYRLATRRGEERLHRQPVAISVHFDRRSRKVVIELNNGCSLLVPRAVAQGLTTASVDDLCDVRVLGPGTAIEWPKLDVQFSVEGLLAGRVGNARWMNELAAAGNAAVAVRRSRSRSMPTHASKKRSARHARS